MPNVTIEIQQPKITQSLGLPYFHVRYRLKGDTAWTVDPVPRTNAPYVYDFPDTGIWEMEVTLVYTVGSECPATIYEIDVREGCNCLEVTETTYSQNQGVTWIKFLFNLPDPQPPCGWIVNINRGSKPMKTLYYIFIGPAVGISFQLDGTETSVDFIANCCNEGTAIGI